MADANHNARPEHTERTVTIQQSRRWRPHPPRRYTEPPLVPWFKLSGRWLEQAEFMPRQRLKIEVQLGRLVITHA